MNEKEAKHLATFLNWLFTTEAWVAVSTDPVEQYSWVALKYRNRRLVAIHNQYSFWLFLQPRLRDAYNVVSLNKRQAKHVAKTLNWLFHEGRWKGEPYNSMGKYFAALRDDTYAGTLISNVNDQVDLIHVLTRYFESDNPLQYEDKDE